MVRNYPWLRISWIAGTSVSPYFGVSQNQRPA